MCGIVGEVNYDAPVHVRWVQQSCSLMQHRGPDASDTMVSSPVALGHRRLSIIDLASGAQPMSYADERYWITYNGEIYNYRDLRRELRAKGYTFSTSSDTEVILAAYAAWGVNSFARLDGIFAFGIWDMRERCLCLVRDQLGIKPLLYHADASGIRFGSELKPLLAHPAVERRLNQQGLVDYLSLGYTLTPHTIIDQIHKLPPAHYLQVREGKPATPHCYWQLTNFIQSAEDHAENGHLKQLQQLIQTTVKDQMVSDVPLGAFLSGGLDSSGIVAFAQAIRENPLNTFSMGFREASFNELDAAQQTADALGTQHHQQIVDPPTFAELRKLVWLYDEPLGDTSIIPTYEVAKLARQQVTVTLSGDGADELFAGYDTYLADRYQRIYQQIPEPIREYIIEPMVRGLPSSYRKVSWDFKLKQFVQHAGFGMKRAHYGWRQMFDRDMALAITGLQTDYNAFDTYVAYYDDVAGVSPLTKSLYVDIKTWLVDDILVKVDRATMAVGLEARVPYLSPRMVEFAMQLPDDLKLRGTNRKYILRQLLQDRLPATTIKRAKRGFNSPVGLWMQRDWHDAISQLFVDRQSDIIDLDASPLRQMWQEHVAGRQDHSFQLWTLLSLLLWEDEVYKKANLQSLPDN